MRKIEYGIVLLFLISIIFRYPKGHDTTAGITLAQEFIECPTCAWGEKMYLGHPKNYEHAPLLLWIESMLETLMGLPSGINLFYILIFFFSFFTMYYYTKYITQNPIISIIASMIYTLCPYHIVEAGLEGHLHLGFAYTLLPLVFLEIDKRIKDKKVDPKSIVIFSAFILSAPQVSILIGPFILIYLLLHLDVKLTHDEIRLNIKGIKTAATYIIVVLLLTSFWWIPIIFEKDYLGQTSYDINSIKLFQGDWQNALFLSPPSSALPTYNQYYLLDPIHRLFLFLPVAIIIMSILLAPNKKNLFYLFSMIFCALLSVGLNFPLYKILWDFVPFFNTIRTPARFMMFASFAYAMMSVYLLNQFKKRMQILLGIIIIFILIVSTFDVLIYTSSGFKLKETQKESFSLLKLEKKGRLFTMSMDAWAYDKKTGAIPNPNYYTWLHGKDVVGGVVPSESTQWTNNILNSLRWGLHSRKMDITNFLRIANVEYVLLDKSYEDSENAVINNTKLLLKYGEIEVYKFKPHPRIYIVEKTESSWDSDIKNLIYPQFQSKKPGKYIVDINLNKNAILVLSESYYPTWTAVLENGTEIKSELAFGFLNSFRLPPGNYKVTLEFRESFVRKITRWISIITLTFIIVALAYEYVWKEL